MPASSAASTTRLVAASSIRPPKLLHPRPTTEASSFPMLRVSIGSVSRRSGGARFAGDARVVTGKHEIGGAAPRPPLLPLHGRPPHDTPPHRPTLPDPA